MHENIKRNIIVIKVFYLTIGLYLFCFIYIKYFITLFPKRVF